MLIELIYNQGKLDGHTESIIEITVLPNGDLVSISYDYRMKL